VLPRGKLLIRAIAMNFDRYLPSDQRIRKYSKIV
jgi:oxygen-independent coproporphyrinogen-3 oxidase